MVQLCFIIFHFPLSHISDGTFVIQKKNNTKLNKKEEDEDDDLLVAVTVVGDEDTEEGKFLQLNNCAL
jgi:hypothetical protein